MNCWAPAAFNFRRLWGGRSGSGARFSSNSLIRSINFPVRLTSFELGEFFRLRTRAVSRVPLLDGSESLDMPKFGDMW